MPRRTQKDISRIRYVMRDGVKILQEGLLVKPGNAFPYIEWQDVETIEEDK